MYVDKAADLDKALNIIENAKTSRRPSATPEEVAIVHADIARQFLPMLKKRLVDDRAAAGLPPVELRLDETAQQIISGTPAGKQDFDTEFLDYILAVKTVSSADEAISHIAAHSTHHSDAIITENAQTAPAALRSWIDQCCSLCKRIHAVYRRRRIQPRLRNGHFHAEAPRQRPYGSAGADDL